MPRNIVIVTGTGRCGSTFLMELFTRLGLDTGWQKGQSLSSYMDPRSCGGLERDLNGDVPYVLKNPYFAGWIPNILGRGFVIDHVIIPMRDADQVALSRASVESRARAEGFCGSVVSGGFWGAKDVAGQKGEVFRKTYELFLSMAEHDLEHTLLHYPRIVEDPAYLLRKLARLLELSGTCVSSADFHEVFARVARPSMVHRY